MTVKDVGEYVIFGAALSRVDDQFLPCFTEGWREELSMFCCGGAQCSL